MLNRSLLIILLFTGFIFTQCKVEKTTKHSTETVATQVIKNIDAAEAKKLLQAGKVTPLDVRTPKEIANGKLDKAVVIDFYNDTFKAELDKLDKNTPYLIYCHSGNRSAKAAAIMKEMGFQSVYNATVGYNDLK